MKKLFTFLFVVVMISCTKDNLLEESKTSVTKSASAITWHNPSPIAKKTDLRWVILDTGSIANYKREPGFKPKR